MRPGVPSAILWIGLAACGRFGFDDEVRPDTASSDSAIDSAPTASCDWSAGPPFTSTAIHRPDLSMSDTEYDPFLVPGDPLTINYVARIGVSGDLFEAHRASTAVPFDAPVMRTDLSTPTFEESALTLERGGLRGYYVSTSGGSFDLYEVERATITDPLQVVRRVDELFAAGERYDAWLFADGLGLAYTQKPPVSASEIRIATRATRDETWSNITILPPTHPNMGGATLTADGLVMVFAADGTSGTKDIYYARRSSLTDTFPIAQLLDVANTLTNGDYEPSLRDDGCEMFFARDGGAGTKWDIYSLPAVTP